MRSSPAERARNEDERADAAAPTSSATSANTTAKTCVLPLPAQQSATQNQIVELLLPAWRPDAGLPQHPYKSEEGSAMAEEGFWVEPCLGPALLSEVPPRLQHVQRLSLDHNRELVQIQLGTQPGMVTYAFGLVALLERDQTQIRALTIEEARGNLERGLAPYTRARLGNAEVVLQRNVTGPEHEDSFGGTYVTAFRASTNGLKALGIINEQLKSHEAFWQGAYDCEMTSSGIEPETSGFVVHERWRFAHRKTHRQSQRSVARHYRLEGDTLVSSPPFDLDAWPETATQAH